MTRRELSCSELWPGCMHAWLLRHLTCACTPLSQQQPAHQHAGPWRAASWQISAHAGRVPCQVVPPCCKVAPLWCSCGREEQPACLATVQGAAAAAAGAGGCGRGGGGRPHGACHHHGPPRVHQAQQAPAAHLHVSPAHPTPPQCMRAVHASKGALRACALRERFSVCRMVTSTLSA